MPNVKKNGFYKDIFDLVKRVNLRAVSKKFIEGLVYSGAFDNFKEYHRAQYLYQPPADVNGIEKIVKFGLQYQAQEAQTANTLFGDLQMPEATTPKLPNCPEWSLTEKLRHEKEATGIFMTGHPLDNFMFEMRHYQFDGLIDFNTAKKIEFTAEIDSIDTNDAQRDAHLKSADFFNGEENKHLKFSGTKYEGKDEDAKLTGELTIGHVTKTITA